MVSPANGVIPNEVSTDTPFLIAVADAPEPMCNVTKLHSDAGLPNIFAARFETYRCDVPWNPYLRTPNSLYHACGTA